ncbi:MAG: TRAP transporter large permease subunit [Dehalococcoidales bacterium]
MTELSPEFLTFLMMGGVLVGVLTGFPIGIVIGALAIIVGFFQFGTAVGQIIYPRVFSLMINYTILAVPMFVFMGAMLERSGITEKLFDALYLWLGGLRGGLAIVTVLVGTIMAACVGIIAASITMLTMVALPAMLKRGYDRSLATGAICAGGCLGILIPPSIMLIVYGPMAQISVGKLLFGAFIPGFILSALYITYIALRCFFQPNIAPAVPIEERGVPFRKKTTQLITSLVPPVLLVLAVLGVIFFGIAPPTEAASMGAFIATLLTVAYGRFNWRVLKDVSFITFRISGFILLIGTMAFAYVGVFIAGGGGDVIEKLILSTPGGKWGIFLVVMLTVFILGMFMDWLPIVFIMVPIITPIAAAQGFDPLWFAIMICVNLQMAFMTPPFAAGIFILKGAAPPEWGVTMGDIIRGVIPFVILVMIGISLLSVFPQLVLWLPSMMIK